MRGRALRERTDLQARRARRRRGMRTAARAATATTARTQLERARGDAHARRHAALEPPRQRAAFRPRPAPARVRVRAARVRLGARQRDLLADRAIDARFRRRPGPSVCSCGSARKRRAGDLRPSGALIVRGLEQRLAQLDQRRQRRHFLDHELLHAEAVQRADALLRAAVAFERERQRHAIAQHELRQELQRERRFGCGQRFLQREAPERSAAGFARETATCRTSANT